MLVGATGDVLPTGATKTWKDIAWSHWSYRYARYALQNNLIDSIGGNEFKPNTSLTRGELAEALYRYLRNKNQL